LPQEWQAAVAGWTKKLAGFRDEDAPSTTDLLFFFQDLVAIWPSGASDIGGLCGRMTEHMRKVAREAKSRTTWTDPDERYEQAMERFVSASLSHKPFTNDVARFVRTIERPGAINAIAEALVRITAPGIPDFYQGTERARFMLVDPDNRAAVGHEQSAGILSRFDRMSERGATKTAMDGLLDGTAKMYVVSRALRHRAGEPDLYRTGAYAPVSATGTNREHCVAFARALGATWSMTVVPRLTAGLGEEPDWRRTSLTLPTGAPAEWREIFSDRGIRARNGKLPLTDVFGGFPVALLTYTRSGP
ncbi:MAG TPA: hypothetical protein VM600_03140, partial [Actinomycetota bacterium]|nr:hypothetical protein [Actinomycetota bacterium]